MVRCTPVKKERKGLNSLVMRKVMGQPDHRSVSFTEPQVEREQSLYTAVLCPPQKTTVIYMYVHICIHTFTHRQRQRRIHTYTHRRIIKLHFKL